MIRWLAAAVVALGVSFGRPVGPAQNQPVTPAELAAAIDQLGSFDFPVRTEAARTVRRAPADQAVAALARAVRGHRDEYVRYKALVLLAGLGDEAAKDLVRLALGDRNDRLRTVAAGWYEHHPDPEIVPALIRALDSEGSEFVRPALTRALAAHGTDSRARDALVPLVMQGEDFFRGAVIEALGDFRAKYALDVIEAVAKLDGPLQDDAITAIGKIGDPASLPLVIELQRSVSRDRQPTVSATLCLMGRSCEAHEKFLRESLEYGITAEGQQPILRSAVHGLGMLAVRGQADALNQLFDKGVPSQDPARAPIALGVGLVALRNPATMLGVLGGRADLDGAIDLLRDAFDMLSEDYEEERFYVFVRRAYWAAAEGSADRRVAEALIRRLEF